MNNNKMNNKQYNVVECLQDYMFTSDNLVRYNKDVYVLASLNKKVQTNEHDFINNYSNTHAKVIKTPVIKTPVIKTPVIKTPVIKTPVIKTPVFNTNIYKPMKKDSLFWCFFILKYGFSKYEMEIGSQHFLVEKTEKYANIDLLRTKENKDLLKINKIKPLSDLEDDLANKERISIKTFFALCVIEKMNILLVDNRKIYQSINNDSPMINVIHRNSKTYEHHIELNVSNEAIIEFREKYYNVSGFDNALKSMTAYKLDELHNICKQLNINILDNVKEKETVNAKPKKLTKKDIYELIVQNF
jgi:hypothetical protein